MLSDVTQQGQTVDIDSSMVHRSCMVTDKECTSAAHTSTALITLCMLASNTYPGAQSTVKAMSGIARKHNACNTKFEIWMICHADLHD